MGSLKVTLLLVATLLSSGPQALDLSSIQGSIFRRVLQSDYVAVGRITYWQRANMRPRPGEPVLDLKWIARGGWLYRFEIEELLCSSKDLEVQAAATGGNPPWPSLLSLFQTRKERRTFPAHQPTPPYEKYPRDDRFLLFVTPRENQQQLPAEYELAAGQIYYRAAERNRGVVSLASPESEGIRRFCEAIQVPDPQEKLARVESLAKIPDSDLQISAQEALEFLRKRVKAASK